MNGERYPAVLLAAVLALTLVGAACSSNGNGGSSGSSGSSGSTGAAADVTMTVKNFAFEPSTVNVSSGSTTIAITNTGSTVHSFTLDDGSVTQDIQPGETQTVTVNLTADAGFHCKYHPTTMTGTLKVG